MLTVRFTERAILSCEEKRKDPIRMEWEILQTLLPSVASSAIALAVPGFSVSVTGTKPTLLALLFFRCGWIVVDQRIIMPGYDRNVLANQFLDIAQVGSLFSITK